MGHTGNDLAAKNTFAFIAEWKHTTLRKTVVNFTKPTC